MQTTKEGARPHAITLSERPNRDALAWARAACAGWSGPPFAIRLWNGESWCSSDAVPVFTVVIGARSSLLRLALGADLAALGDEVVAGGLDVEGDLLAAFDLARHVRSAPTSLLARLGAVVRLALGDASPRPSRDPTVGGRTFGSDQRSGSAARAREAVNFHYDLPHALFRLFLDEQDVYSCAYFQSADESLDAAQIHKLEHVCRKLRLTPDSRLLDLGCGWGALSIHAARHYGARVLGITLSEAQAAVARERIARAQLGDRCQIEVHSFEDLEGANRFDAIASVGAIEHIPLTKQATYFRRCFELLEAGGRMLNHGITSLPHAPLAGGNRFLRKYIFPEHEIVPVHASLAAAQAVGFEVRDVESLREHYGLTLAAWYRRLEAHDERARSLVGDPVFQAFRVYLAGMSWHFAHGSLDVHQSLLSKSDDGQSGMPLTRADLYVP